MPRSTGNIENTFVKSITNKTALMEKRRPIKECRKEENYEKVRKTFGSVGVTIM